MQNFTNTEAMPKKTLLAICCALLYSQSGFTAETVEYDSSFLMGSGASSIDISKYSDGNPTPAGTYDVKVFVNDKPISSLSIPFIDIGKKARKPV